MKLSKCKWPPQFTALYCKAKVKLAKKNRQTCCATLLQRELKSYVARFTTQLK